ncbi:MAG: metallophosphoesterase [Clostridiaceae bacterium]|nr:metallophosphoesterase [Clostridiaceae bacterium]
MKILHTADWHLGTFRSPMKDGVNLRTEDTKRCLDELVRVAKEEQPDYSLISGDVFHVGRLWSDRCCEEIITAIHYIRELAAASKQVIVMRGTPNHDGAGQFNVLSEMFADCPNVHVVITPQVISFDDVDIAVLPGFDRGVYRAKFPGLSSEEENEVFTQELSNIVLGLKAACDPDKKSILMAHYTVPGANTESGQVMMLTQFEPIIPRETLMTADFDLVALGHIHRPQKFHELDWYYSGAINAITFNDEGQERGFWLHEWNPIGVWQSFFHKTPIREFHTITLNNEDVQTLNTQATDLVATMKWRGLINEKIVRVHYSCSAENSKAMNKAVLEKELLDDGAFMVWEILPDKIDEFANKTELTNATDPEANLVKYLEEKQVAPEKVQELVMKARPIIAEAEASMTAAANTGIFEPIEIAVKNYRNYEEETFNFEDITFCTINGQNGAGKSSLFMDAIIDCLFEEPREGVIKDDTGKSPWLRNDEKVRSGSIMFTFRIGEKKYRVTRTRARSGKGTLNIAQFVDGEWEDRSKERYNDTQQEILNILGMDSFTFKSCALIMQDQYGLFLQAKPEERVEVLGTLLGLGIYQSMEKIAQDKAKGFGAKTREIKQEIEIHNNTIAEYGKPDEELAVCNSELEKTEQLLQSKVAERDKNKLLLTHQQEAAERRTKLLTAISTLQAKRTATEQNRAIQQTIVAESSAILAEKAEIEAKVAEYNALVEREKALAAEAALYSSKVSEVADLEQQIRTNETQHAELQSKLQSEITQKTALEVPVDEETIRKNAADYEMYNEQLSKMKDLQIRWNEAKSVSDGKRWAADAEKKRIEQELQRLNGKKADLERRTELLQNSGCSNIDNAECRFLADALDAKKQIPIVESEIEEFQAESEKKLQELYAQADEAEKAVAAVGFDSARLYECTIEVGKLAQAPAQLRELEERANKIALISAAIDNTKSNISECEQRLATVKLKAAEVEQERTNYKKSFEEHTIVSGNILTMRVWLEKEKQLPVAAERNTTALARTAELTAEISNIDADIAEKQVEADKEISAMNGMEELARLVAGMEMDINGINLAVKNLQMKIGALQQKAEQIQKLKSEIAGLQEQQSEYATETVDYDTLKIAFSQSGVPHQIIRSIIPQLTATANSILGQMTGGKMGVEFRLERLLKNGKEKVSLDIFIEEYGKSVLPYLSKSGGEKVKSSLSVILALAEIKSSSAGIQLGMLFIDEPPFLDGDGIQAYCDALETIQSRYSSIKIMAITHDPTMKARFPQNLDVVKTENGSKVIY